MSFVKSANKITLTSGEKIFIYYISESGKKELEKIIEALPYIYKRLNRAESRQTAHLDNRLRLLEDLLKDEITNKFYLEYREILKSQDPNKSFRSCDFLGKSATPFYWDIKREVFEKLIEAGFIEERGSGWYRVKEVPK